jgi:hypothetical protein
MNNKELLTVKEVAEIVGVSTQYIYRLLQTDLKPYVMNVDNKRYIKTSAITDFFDIELQTINKKPTENVQPTNHDLRLEIDYINLLKEQLKLKDSIIESQESTIKEKDLHVKELTDTITDLSDRIAVLFENSQKLEQNRQLLEAAETLETAGNSVTSNEETETIETNKKQSFFKRLFKLR